MSYALPHACDGIVIFGGRSWIWTSEGLRRQIYSLLPLTRLGYSPIMVEPPGIGPGAHRSSVYRSTNWAKVPWGCKVGLEPTTTRATIWCSANWATCTKWCTERDLNPQVLYGHKNLNLACLPISPSGQLSLRRAKYSNSKILKSQQKFSFSSGRFI